MFGVFKSMRLGAGSPYVRGLKFLMFGGFKSLRSGAVNPYVRGL